MPAGFNRPAYAPPALAYVQSTSTFGTAANTITAQFVSAQTQGNCNLVFVGYTTVGGTITGVTDSAGNKYSLLGTQAAGTAIAVVCYYASNIAFNKSNTITVTSSSSTVTGVTISEYAATALNIVSSSPTDSAGTATVTISPTAKECLIVGSFWSNATTGNTNETGWNQRQSGSNAVALSWELCDQIGTSAAYSITATNNGTTGANFAIALSNS